MLLVQGKIESADMGNEVAIWRWLLKVMETLTADGMSSEESDLDDNVNVVFRTKRLPWRRNIDLELRIIDTERVHVPTNFGKSGAKPAMRSRGGHDLVSERDPVDGLPRRFYDDKWFESEGRKMAVSKENFIWMKIIHRMEDEVEAEEEEL